MVFVKETPISIIDGIESSDSFLGPILLENPNQKYSYLGQIRENIPYIDCVDLLLIRNEIVIGYIAKRFGQTREGNLKLSGYVKGVLINCYVCNEDDFASHLFYFSGKKKFVDRFILAARKKGIILNQYGGWKDNKKLTLSTEEDIFALNNMVYIAPEDRI